MGPPRSSRSKPPALENRSLDADKATPSSDRAEFSWGAGVLAAVSLLGVAGGVAAAPTPPTPVVQSAISGSLPTSGSIDLSTNSASLWTTTGVGSPAVSAGTKTAISWAESAAAAITATTPNVSEASTTPAEVRLLEGVQAMVDGKAPTPVYLGGLHDNWRGNSDHCYSIYFRVALRQGLLSESQAEAIVARLPVSDKDAWRDVMFPDGFREVPFSVTADGISANVGTIPAGHLVSFDGGDHIMMSTGRRTPNGGHEVYSFKGGGPETPVWGDSVGWDPAAKIHITTVESELEALQRDDQALDGVKIVEGTSVLGLLPVGSGSR